MTMTSRAAQLVALAAALVLPPSAAHAGGFYVPEIGGRGLAMSGAMTAQAEDTTTIFHNPGGLPFVTGARLQLSSALFLPHVEHFRRPVTDPASGDTIRFARVTNTNAIGAVPFAGAVFDVGVPRLTLGVSLAVPFGATLEYPSDGAQRFVVTAIALRTIYAGPAVAYRVHPTLGVGASLNYVYSDIRLEQENALQFVTGDPEQAPNPDPAVEGSNAIDAKDSASLSASFGVRWTPTPRVAAGLAVMTPTTLRFEGDIDVRNAGIAELRDSSGTTIQPAGRRTDGVAFEFPLPLVVRLGALVRPTPRLALALDLNWQRWSTFEKLELRFTNHHELLATPGANLYDVTLENAWKDTFSVRAAASYTVPWSRPLEVRGGLVFDQSPIDDRHFDVLTPDSDKLGVSAGVGTQVCLGGRRLDIDLGYMHLFLAERDVAPGAGGQSGSDRTILNKPAPSFFHGVTRARFDLFAISLTMHLQD